jgi:hypothetical protein
MKEKTHLTLLLLIAAIAIPSLTGCAFSRKAARSWETYWREESGMTPGPVKRNNLELTSSNPADYILPNGTGIAVPAKVAEEYYISPFAPHAGYLSSRLPGGSEVICPFSGRILILGEREYVAEKELN